jgi:hypothetical protein
MAQRSINADFVDFNGHKYEPGEEDALALVLPKRDVEIFMEKGILKGDWLAPEVRELPAVSDLPDHLSDLNTIEEVRALQQRDTRKSAAKHYTDRIAELEAK